MVFELRSLDGETSCAEGRKTLPKRAWVSPSFRICVGFEHRNRVDERVIETLYC